MTPETASGKAGGRASRPVRGEPAGRAHERVAVVVVMYNSRPLLTDLVASLSAGLAGVDFELVAVDNASPDDSVELIDAIAPGTTIVRTGRNGGYAAGINPRVAAAGAHTAILVLNADVRLGPGCVADLLAGLRQPGIAIMVLRHCMYGWLLSCVKRPVHSRREQSCGGESVAESKPLGAIPGPQASS